MKKAEFVDSAKKADRENGGFYSKEKVGLWNMYYDLMDAIEEEYIEGMSVDKPDGSKMEVHCEDGVVTVLNCGGLYFDTTN